METHFVELNKTFAPNPPWAPPGVPVPDYYTDYACGFAFSQDMKQVLLIEKQKPAWQAGKKNGIGGKIEQYELAIDAMVREFHEETGVASTTNDWEQIVELVGSDWRVCFFRSFTVDIFAARHVELEKPVIFNIEQLHQPDAAVMPNLRWLIPLALDKDVLFPLLVEQSDRKDPTIH